MRNIQILLEWKNGSIGQMTMWYPPPPTLIVRKLLDSPMEIEQGILNEPTKNVRYRDITFRRINEVNSDVPLYQEED